MSHVHPATFRVQSATCCQVRCETSRDWTQFTPKQKLLRSNRQLWHHQGCLTDLTSARLHCKIVLASTVRTDRLLISIFHCKMCLSSCVGVTQNAALDSTAVKKKKSFQLGVLAFARSPSATVWFPPAAVGRQPSNCKKTLNTPTDRPPLRFSSQKTKCFQNKWAARC